MRIAIAAGWVVAGIAALWFGGQMLVPPVHGQPASVSVPEPGGLIAILLSRSEAGDRIAVIDPRTRAMAVYQIGQGIRLESQRPLHWDLQMSGFNSEGPSPEEVRLGLERRGQ